MLTTRKRKREQPLVGDHHPRPTKMGRLAHVDRRPTDIAPQKEFKGPDWEESLKLTSIQICSQQATTSPLPSNAAREIEAPRCELPIEVVLQILQSAWERRPSRWEAHLEVQQWYLYAITCRASLQHFKRLPLNLIFDAMAASNFRYDQPNGVASWILSTRMPLGRLDLPWNSMLLWPVWFGTAPPPKAPPFLETSADTLTRLTHFNLPNIGCTEQYTSGWGPFEIGPVYLHPCLTSLRNLKVLHMNTSFFSSDMLPVSLRALRVDKLCVMSPVLSLGRLTRLTNLWLGLETTPTNMHYHMPDSLCKLTLRPRLIRHLWVDEALSASPASLVLDSLTVFDCDVMDADLLPFRYRTRCLKRYSEAGAVDWEV